ncbi:MAG TPA: glycerol kinase GlpK [Acidobacteriota bacterium]|nr:glycerol kinase GlpK [Acidobacteriota bacterium]
MPDFIGAIDQGTTSTRFMVFDHNGQEVGKHQVEHRQILPGPGLVEHDPLEILENTQAVIRQTMNEKRLTAKDLAAIGVTNQRETTVVWNPKTGQPWCNAIVWQDTRTQAMMARLEQEGKGELIRSRTGLPPSSYFSAGKIRWILDSNPEIAEAARRGEAIFGNIDTWIIWNLTGGKDGGKHVTDVTNASRTMLMNLSSCAWDPELLDLLGIPRELLPDIRSSSEVYGTTRSDGPFGGEIPISGDLGDQQAATVGQACFHPGEAKNTYGTGNFMLLNTGQERVRSKAGLLTTACYRLQNQPTIFALEGSIAVTGSAVQWLRDQLGMIRNAAEIEELANTVEDNGGVYFVPAFSGLFAPYWRPDARGAIVGLSRYATKGHIARATLEAICYQTRDVLHAMEKDSQIQLTVLKVDGGATVNNTLMQIQADILGVPVVRPSLLETTSLGAAYAAGLAVSFWTDTESLRANWKSDRQWVPQWSEDRRESHYAEWQRAVDKSMGWQV